jgi:hypothetical protein
MLIASVTDTGRRRRIIKFAYDQEFPWSSGPFSTRLDRLSGRFGWTPTPIRFAIPQVGFSESYHFEAQAPSGLEVIGVGLHEPRSLEYAEVRTAGRHNIVHLHIAGAPVDARTDVRVLFRATRGLAMGACFASSLTAAVLVAAALAQGTVRGILNQADAAAAILLSALSIAAAVVARPGEHLIASRLLLGTRILVLTAGLAAYVAAVFIVAHSSERVLSWSLWICAAAALGAALGLWLALLRRK